MALPVSVKGRRLGILMLGMISCGALPLSIIMLLLAVERPADDDDIRNEAAAAAAAEAPPLLSVPDCSSVRPGAPMEGPKWIVLPSPLSKLKLASRLIGPSPPRPPLRVSSISDPERESRREDGLLIAESDAGPGVPSKLAAEDSEKRGEKFGGRAERGAGTAWLSVARCCRMASGVLGRAGSSVSGMLCTASEESTLSLSLAWSFARP